MQCDALIIHKLSTDLRTLSKSKYIVEYSFVFPLVQDVSKFVEKHRGYSPT